MRSIRNLPIWALALVLFAVTGGLWFLLGFLITPDLPLVVRLVGTLFYAGVMATFFTIWVARARNRAGGANELDRVAKSLRSGNVPADADVSTWTATIDAQYHQLHRNLWLGPAVFGLAIPVSTWLAVTQDWFWWAAVAFCVTALVWSIVSTPRGLRKIALVREELARRSAATSSGLAPSTD